MPLQYKSEHTECRYYANQSAALFRKWQLPAGNTLPELNHNKGIIMFVETGKIEITLGQFPAGDIPAGSIVFIPQNIAADGKAIADSSFFTCAVQPQIPLCSRYDLVAMHNELKAANKGFLPPPMHSSNRCKQAN